MTCSAGRPDVDRTLPVLNVRHPGDLIETVPYLLGFHPRESLVVVGLAAQELGRPAMPGRPTQGYRVVLTARLDLADLHPRVDPCGGTDVGADIGAGLAAETEAEAEAELDDDALASVVHAVVRAEATAMVALIYTGEAPTTREDRAGTATFVLPQRALLTVLGRALEREGVEPIDALLVGEHRWWSYLCTDEACCSSAGRDRAGDSSSAAAGATYAGLVALPDRDALAELLAPDDDVSRAAMLSALEAAENDAVQAVLYGHRARHERSVKRAIFAAARDADDALFVGLDGLLADDEISRYAAALVETSIRDAVWLAIDQGRLDGRPLWRQLSRRLPSPYDAAPLFLFGWAEWRAGNGALAGIAAERALSSDPTYTAADLLLGALRHGLDPRRTPRLRMPRSA